MYTNKERPARNIFKKDMVKIKLKHRMKSMAIDGCYEISCSTPNNCLAFAETTGREFEIKSYIDDKSLQ